MTFELVRAMGAELVNGKEITSVDELKKEQDSAAEKELKRLRKLRQKLNTERT